MKSRRTYGPGWVAVSGVAVVVWIGFGAWWTAVAAYEGEVGSMFFRLGLSIVGGTYYAVLHQVAKGRSLQFGPQRSTNGWQS